MSLRIKNDERVGSKEDDQQTDPNIEIEKVLREIDSNLLESFKLFDLFYDETGNQMNENKKSIAYSLTYRNHERTLKSAEVDTEHEKVLSKLKTKLPIEFR